MCNRQIQKVVLYSEDDVHQLDWEQSCWDKLAIISSDRVFDHILDMDIWSTWTGCSLNPTPNYSSGDDESLSVAIAGGLGDNTELTDSSSNGVDGVNLTCRGEHRYDTPQKVYDQFSCMCVNISNKKSRPHLSQFHKHIEHPLQLTMN